MPQLPPTMTAIQIREKGGPEVLEAVTLPTPAPADGEVLIKVAAAGVNRPDVLQRMGAYPPPKGHSPLPGLEVSGEIVAVGAGVARWTGGEMVCALVNGGGYAEYCLADAGSVLPIPKGIDLVQAAGLPETSLTVWNNVFDRGGLKSGEWLLVHGGTSGIGVAAIQMAKAAGAKVIATAGSDAKCQRMRELGADVVVNYKSEDFVAAAKTATAGKGVDVILDMVGGDYIEKDIAAAAEDGRIVFIAFLGGAEAKVNFARVMMKRLTLTGSTLRARTAAVKAGFARAVEANIWPLIEAGRIKPVLDSTWPLAQAGEAHRRMEQGQHIGKIILVVGNGNG